MRLSVKVNLNKLYNEIPSYAYFITFSNVANLTNVSFQDSETVTNIELYSDSNYDLYLAFYTSNPVQQPEYEGEDQVAVDFSGTNTYISLTADIEDITVEDFLKLINDGYIELDQFGNTNIIAYRLNDERHKLNKSLTPVTIIEGKFTAPLGIKALELDVVNYDINNSYNYVYIPSLKRYYYVTNIQLTTKNHTKLILQEDVLMSWSSLIKEQVAFVTRYGGSNNILLYDDRYPLIDESNISYIKPSNVTGSNVKQFKLVMPTISGTTEKAPNVFMKATTTLLTLTDDSQNISAPSGTNLPNIQSKRSGHERYYLMPFNTFGYIIDASIKNNAPSSYIHSALLLPFDLRDIFDDETSGEHIFVGDKVLTSGNEWKAQSETTNAPTCFMTKKGGSPYIKVADFNFNASGNVTLDYNYRDYSPVTQWEIYIPFVGWQTLDPVAVIGKRIQVYYTFDFDTGLSTCYLYNYTDQVVIWSGSCQIGMKLTLATTNANELAIQKNATTLNLIMGLLSSALSIGVGAYSGNAVAVMGGIMGTGKTVSSAVNSYNALIERAQITYGTSDNALYSPMEVVIRKTTHAKLVNTTDEENRYKELNGYPYKEYVALSSLTTGNYVEVGEIHFNAKSNNIYQVEIEEIIALLKNGVII